MLKILKQFYSKVLRQFELKKIKVKIYLFPVSSESILAFRIKQSYEQADRLKDIWRCSDTIWSQEFIQQWVFSFARRLGLGYFHFWQALNYFPDPGSLQKRQLRNEIILGFYFYLHKCRPKQAILQIRPQGSWFLNFCLYFLCLHRNYLSISVIRYYFHSQCISKKEQGSWNTYDVLRVIRSQDSLVYWSYTAQISKYDKFSVGTCDLEILVFQKFIPLSKEWVFLFEFQVFRIDMKFLVVQVDLGFESKLKAKIVSDLVWFKVSRDESFENGQFGQIRYKLKLPIMRIFELKSYFEEFVIEFNVRDETKRQIYSFILSFEKYNSVICHHQQTLLVCQFSHEMGLKNQQKILTCKRLKVKFVFFYLNLQTRNRTFVLVDICYLCF